MAYFQTTYTQPIRSARSGQSIVAAYQPIDGLGGLGGEVGFPLPAWATRRTLILGALALVGIAAYVATRKGKRMVSNARRRRRHRRN
jgi:hypothetical protein